MNRGELVDHGQTNGRKGELTDGVDEIQCEEPPHGCFLTICQSVGAKGDDGVSDGQEEQANGLFDG